MEDLANPADTENIDDDAAETLELEQELFAARDEAKRIKKALAALERRKSSLQKKIAAWQKRYDAMNENQKEGVRLEFEESTLWRTQEINLIEYQINALEAQAAIARESAKGVALHLEPLGFNTGPRARRHGRMHRSRRQREIRARARENHWGQRMNKLRVRLKAERSRGRPAKKDLETAAAAAEKKLACLEAAVRQAKVQIKKRKRELSEWKQWYGNLAQIDKTTEKAALDREVAWRADEIQGLQKRIGALEAKSLNAMGEMEQARIQLEALEAGAYDRPLDDDPRLAHVQIERKAAAAALVRARKSADRPRQTKSDVTSKKRKSKAAKRPKPARTRSRK